MIPDNLFKKLEHSFEGYSIYLNGQVLEKGYKPDFVLKKDNSFIILESENATSRKTFVGGMIKAAHFLQGEKHGKLIFVVVPRNNTKIASIANHLKPYYNWIRDKTNLNEIQIIDAEHYLKNQIVIKLDSEEFNSVSISIQ